MTPDEKFRAAVARWLGATFHEGATVDPSGVDLSCSAGGCDTCGPEVEFEVSWTAPDGRSGCYSVPPYDLGAWIGALL